MSKSMVGYGQTVLLSAILLIAMMAILPASSISITATLVKPSTTSTTTSSTTTIMPAPSVSVSPGLQSVNIGQSFTITSNTISIGAGGIYQWFNDTSGTPNAIAGANMLNYNSISGAIGMFTYYLTINDIMGNNIMSNNALVIVDTPTTIPSSGGGGGYSPTGISSMPVQTPAPTTTSTTTTTVPTTTTSFTTILQTTTSTTIAAPTTTAPSTRNASLLGVFMSTGVAIATAIVMRRARNDAR